MTRNIMGILWAKIAFLLLYAAVTSVAAIAQTDVEIEIAGPWSYVQDPADSSRVIVVAPDVGHIMAVFTGGNPFTYSSPTSLGRGPHRLDFATTPCGSTAASSYFLYPANGVSSQTITNVVASTSAYSLSLPKPCSYEDRLESVFKYEGIRPIMTSDPERSFTTWMILHYKLDATSTGAVLDKGTAPVNIPFGTNIGSTKLGISVILYQNTAPDTACDSHSAKAFDATLALWGLPHVYRVFPQLIDLPSQNSNQQRPGSYTAGCAQTFGSSPTAMANSSHTKVSHRGNRAVAAKQEKRAPGRADCHATQVNVNGVVS